MNVKGFKIDFSKFLQYNIDFKHSYIKKYNSNYLICCDDPQHRNSDYFLFTDGKSYLSINVDGCIVVVHDCRRAYLNNNIIALGAFYDNIPGFLFGSEKWYLETFENANNLRVRETLYANAKIRMDNENEANVNEYFENERRAKRINFSRELRKKVFEKNHGRCAICGMPLSLERSSNYNYATVDHIIPLDKGGRNEMSNYQATCKTCNEIKTNIMPEVFEFKFKSVMVDRLMEDADIQRELAKKIIQIMFKKSMMAIKAMIL